MAQAICINANFNAIINSLPDHKCHIEW